MGDEVVVALAPMNIWPRSWSENRLFALETPVSDEIKTPFWPTTACADTIARVACDRMRSARAP